MAKTRIFQIAKSLNISTCFSGASLCGKSIVSFLSTARFPKNKSRKYSMGQPTLCIECSLCLSISEGSFQNVVVNKSTWKFVAKKLSSYDSYIAISVLRTHGLLPIKRPRKSCGS